MFPSSFTTRSDARPLVFKIKARYFQKRALKCLYRLRFNIVFYMTFIFSNDEIYLSVNKAGESCVSPFSDDADLLTS